MRRLDRSNLRSILLRPYFVGILGLLIALLAASPYLLDIFWGNVPITFYGRVVDESGKGVAGAEVTMRVSALERLSVPVPFGAHQTSWPVKAVTGKDGTFQIRGGRGISIQLVEIRKPGYGLYILTQSGANFVYTSDAQGVMPYQPDRQNPALFRRPHLKG